MRITKFTSSLFVTAIFSFVAAHYRNAEPIERETFRIAKKTEMYKEAAFNSNLAADTFHPINLCERYEKLKSFLLPINSGNFYYVFDKVKLDSASVIALRHAHLLSVKPCEQSPMINDKVSFLQDIDTTESFLICRWDNFQGSMPLVGFFILENTNSDRCYLITYKLINQKKDFIKAIDAVLINYNPGGSSHESYHRNTVFYDINKITMEENCYEYKLFDLQNKYNLSINQNGKITMTLLSQKKNGN